LRCSVFFDSACIQFGLFLLNWYAWGPKSFIHSRQNQQRIRSNYVDELQNMVSKLSSYVSMYALNLFNLLNCVSRHLFDRLQYKMILWIGLSSTFWILNMFLLRWMFYSETLSRSFGWPMLLHQQNKQSNGPHAALFVCISKFDISYGS